MNKKRHHYIPKAYLKFFGDSLGKIHVYFKDEPGKLIHQSPYEESVPKPNCFWIFHGLVIGAITLGYVSVAIATEPLLSAIAVSPPVQCVEGLELNVARQLGYPDREAIDYPPRMVCKPAPSAKDNKSIVVLSFMQKSAQFAPPDQDMGTYDLDVLVVKSDSGKIQSRLLMPQAVSSDAWRFDGLAIDTARYTLAPGVRAFGVRVTHTGSSRVSPTDETTLSLYVERGGKLHPILNGLVISKSHADFDMQCAGEFMTVERTIAIGKTTSHGFADLIVMSTTRNSEHKLIKDECVEFSQTPNIERYTLRHDGKAYVVPQSLQEYQ